MNLKKLIKWSFVLGALFVVKDVTEPMRMADNKPVYISTQKSGQ